MKNYWLRFLISGVIAFTLIYIFYAVLRQNDKVDRLYVDILHIYAKFLLAGSKFLTELFGFEVVTWGKTIRILDDFKAGGVYLDRGCMGRNVMIGFAALIAVFPGKFIHKLWYIPMGLFVITLVNIMRISGLAITAYCCPQYSDINHYLIFKIVAWAVIFLMWVFWFNHFSPFSKQQKKRKHNKLS